MSSIMNYCPSCGAARANDTAQFCHVCGTSLVDKGGQVATSASHPSMPQSPLQAPYQTTSSTIPSPQSSSRGRIFAIIGGGCILLALIVFFGPRFGLYYLYRLYPLFGRTIGLGLLAIAGIVLLIVGLSQLASGGAPRQITSGGPSRGFPVVEQGMYQQATRDNMALAIGIMFVLAAIYGLYEALIASSGSSELSAVGASGLSEGYSTISSLTFGVAAIAAIGAAAAFTLVARTPLAQNLPGLRVGTMSIALIAALVGLILTIALFSAGQSALSFGGIIPGAGIASFGGYGVFFLICAILALVRITQARV